MVTAVDSAGNPSNVQVEIGKAVILQTASTVPSTGENPSGPPSNVQTDINVLRSGLKTNSEKIAENKHAIDNLSAAQIKTTSSTTNVQQMLDELQSGMGGIISTIVGGIDLSRPSSGSVDQCCRQFSSQSARYSRYSN